MAICVSEAAVSSICAVRQHLQNDAAGMRPDDADGPVAAAAAELHQRAARLARAGLDVRVSDDVAALLASPDTHRKGWG
jgi:hypothetical protein